ncbi:MAG: hypothetical protein V1913_17730 [Fibrobacterota bacterium]
MKNKKMGRAVARGQINYIFDIMLKTLRCLFLAAIFVIPLSAQEGDGLPPLDTDDAAPAAFLTDTTEADSAADSLAYELIGLNEHIGVNGLSFSVSFVAQTYGRGTVTPSTRTFGAGVSGDILTGLSFIHLVPVLHYWGYGEKVSLGPVVRRAYRDASLSFNAVFMTPRFTARKLRLYGGGGPSIHITISSEYDEKDNAWSVPAFKNGLGGLVGLELPLNGMVSFLATGSYKQIYDWSELSRRIFVLSLGISI